LISREVIYRTRLGVCALGFRRKRPKLETSADGDPYLKESGFEIIGTGFLVADDIVLTNRHVLEGIIASAPAPDVPRSDWLARFQTPATPGHGEFGWRYWRLLEATYSRIRNFDAALFRVERTPHEWDERTVTPEAIPIAATSADVYVGDAVGVVGFPFGTSHQETGELVLRFEPVFQQGFVSAVSPSAFSRDRSEYVLDVRTTKGMSGAPIVNTDGEAIGLHWGGRGENLAVAHVITRHEIQAWVKLFRDRIALEG
jgi:glutamyl endopeptidase